MFNLNCLNFNYKLFFYIIKMPLNMKVFLCTDRHLIDCNDKYLEAGKYYFNIESFSKKNTVYGNIIDKNDLKSKYEFRCYTLITMMAKSQSYLSRRAKINNKNMPNYPSPKTLKKPLFSTLSRYVVIPDEEEQIEECSICLEKLEKNNSVVILECSHKFHDKCIKNWMKIKKTCPICRKKIKIKEFI
tara:strand:- start:4 stop:564 length:561 start_codon:yes stop_codon:yes gene_type:complete